MENTYKQVSGRNHIEFMQNFVAAIREGYYLSGEHSQLPVDGPILTVFLFKEPTVALHKAPTGMKFTSIQNFHLHEFLTNVQQAVIEDYDIEISTLSWRPWKVVHFVANEGQKPKKVKAKKENKPVE